MLLAATSNGLYGFSPTLTTLDGEDVTAIAATEGRLLATPRGKGLQQSVNGGKAWLTVLDGVNARCVTFGPDGAAYLGADPAAVYKSGGKGFEELEGVRRLPTFPIWNFPGAPHKGNIHDFAFSPGDSDTIYAAVEVGGVIISHDGGKTWVERREGIHLDVHAIASAPGEADDVLYAATGQGFFRSLNAGRTWQSACEGFASLYLAPLAVHPARPEVVFTAATQGRPRYWRDRDGGARATIYRTMDGGDTWLPAMNGLPETLPGAVSVLAIDPADPDTVYAGTADGRLLAGDDLGARWRTLADDLPPVHGVRLHEMPARSGPRPHRPRLHPTARSCAGQRPHLRRQSRRERGLPQDR